MQATITALENELAREKALGRGVSAVVADAVIDAFPDAAAEILGDIRRNGDHWYFNRWGMYVGIEDDGYIHT